MMDNAFAGLGDYALECSDVMFGIVEGCLEFVNVTPVGCVRGGQVNFVCAHLNN